MVSRITCNERLASPGLEDVVAVFASLRSLFVALFGEEKFAQVVEHLREQLLFAVVMLSWLAMLSIVDAIVGPRVITYTNWRLADPIHLIEDISLLMWALIALIKLIRGLLK